jgi:hypothetical protein
MQISEIDGQGFKQFLELGSAFLLSAAIDSNGRFVTKVLGYARTP